MVAGLNCCTETGRGQSYDRNRPLNCGNGAPLRNRTVDLLLNMHAVFVQRRRVGSGYRRSQGLRCLSTSCSVCHYLGSLSLGLSLAIPCESPPPTSSTARSRHGILKPQERTGANRSVQATFLRSPTPLRGTAPDGAVPGQRAVRGASARQAWVPSECSTSTRAELGQGCWRRAWLGHLLAAAKLCRRRGGRQRAPGHLGGGVASRPVPSQLGRRRQRV